jgi:hypothetical protein
VFGARHEFNPSNKLVLHRRLLVGRGPRVLAGGFHPAGHANSWSINFLHKPAWLCVESRDMLFGQSAERSAHALVCRLGSTVRADQKLSFASLRAFHSDRVISCRPRRPRAPRPRQRSRFSPLVSATQLCSAGVPSDTLKRSPEQTIKELGLSANRAAFLFAR